MARITFDTSKVTKELRKKFEGFIDDKDSMDKYGKRLVRNIRADAIDGKNHKGENFPSLSREWVLRKARLSSVNSLSRFYSKGKSNVTFMGDLVKGVAYELKTREIELLVQGNHRAVIGVKGKVLKGSTAKLSVIYSGLVDIDDNYAFLGPSDASNEYLIVLFKRYLRRKL